MVPLHEAVDHAVNGLERLLFDSFVIAQHIVHDAAEAEADSNLVFETGFHPPVSVLVQFGVG